MTNLQALKGKLAYPLSDNSFILALNDRGLVETATYAINIAAFELAFADVITTLLTAGNVREGGYSVSITDKKTLADMAERIYAKHGEARVPGPTAKFVQRW